MAGRARTTAEDEILAMRSDWQPVDRHFIAELATILEEMHAEELHLRAEGTIVNGRVNPRFNLVEELVRRAWKLTKYLGVDPSAVNGRDPSLVRGIRQAEREARIALGR
jgi:phage terminase small subunit